MKGINWLGVVLGLIAGQVIGFLWYGVLFQRRWMELNGLDPDAPMEMSMDDNLAMGAGAVVTLVVVIGLAILIKRIGAQTLMGGAKWGLFAAFLFGATTVALRALYSTEPFGLDTWCLWSIDAFYLLVYFPVAGALIGGVGKRT